MKLDDTKHLDVTSPRPNIVLAFSFPRAHIRENVGNIQIRHYVMLTTDITIRLCSSPGKFVRRKNMLLFCGRDKEKSTAVAC